MMKLLKLSTALAMTVSIAGIAGAQDLFDDVSLMDDAPELAVNLDGQMRVRQVMVNMDMAGDVFRETTTSNAMSLTLFPGATVNLTRTDLDMDFGEGTRSWIGRVDGFEDGYATLISDKVGRIIGQVQYGGKTFRITPTEYGLHSISEIAPSGGNPLLSDEHDEDVCSSDQAESVNEKTESSTPTTEGWPIVTRVLYMYTHAAEDEALAAGTTIRDEALLAAGLVKTAMISTGLKTYRIQYAGVRGFGPCGYTQYDAASTLAREIRDIRGCVGSHSKSKRDELEADLIAVLKAGDVCRTHGFSFANHDFEQPVSATTRICISDHKVTHGIGHNFGLKHDRYWKNDIGQNQDEGYYGISFPYRDQPVKTIMAMDNECDDLGITCARVPVFSNMARTGEWNNQRMGRGLHQTDPAIARNYILKYWDKVANYR